MKLKSLQFRYHLSVISRAVNLDMLRMGLGRGASQNIIAIIFDLPHLSKNSSIGSFISVVII